MRQRRPGIARASRSKAHVNRNLLQCIRKHGVTFPVAIDTVLISIRLHRPRTRTIQIHWPILPMRAWLNALVSDCPQFLFAGHTSCEAAADVFTTFWRKFRQCEPNHCIFGDGKELSRCIPVFFHGDEGRGARKTPFLVQSWQPVISHLGLNATNMSGSIVCKCRVQYHLRAN